MKELIIAIAVAGLLGADAFAGDPGGMQGFVCARFDGENASGVIEQNVCDVTTTPDFYQAHFGSRQTYGVVFYMWMERNIQNRFGWVYDRAFVTLKVEDKTLVSQYDSVGDCIYTPTESGWYRVEIRVSTGNYSGGVKSGNAGNGIKWRTSDGETKTDYRRLDSAEFLALTRTGLLSQYKVVSNYETQPFILSSSIRANDSTVLDVDYIVLSPRPTVNVRALAFEDGERSFWKVVRPETFVKDVDGNETAQNIGDGIAANVEHKLAWKVSADWKTDLAKVKFEVLTSEMAQLPLKTVTIPAAKKFPALTVAINGQNDEDVFNALLWHYADAANDLEIKDGYLYTKAGTLLSERDNLGSADREDGLRYLYEKIGWEPLENMMVVDFVKNALRKYDLAFNSETKNLAVPKNGLPAYFYVGEKAYWWADLETGESGYLDSAPLAGWSNEYKTTKLLMRRIEPGEVLLGGVKPVTISEPFYMGVFEVTQKQYELVNGSSLECWSMGEMRPVDNVKYNAIRGASKGSKWPSGVEFDSSSWLGKLKTKVGVSLDLPTEAQWEYACRAGTVGRFNNGGSSVADLSKLGRWKGNTKDGLGGYTNYHTTVGAYFPNAWGLFDMHGNVMEWCLDWYGTLNSDPVNDWAGANSGSYRVLRNGGAISQDTKVESSYRDNNINLIGTPCYGFRLCRAVIAGAE